MDNSKVKRQVSRRNRVFRVRKKVRGTESRPRFSVSKTNKHIYAQIIDDVTGVTLVGFGTLSTENKSTAYNCKSKEAARFIGKKVGQMALEKNIPAVVFDRGRFKYHGIVAEVADGAREAGLSF